MGVANSFKEELSSLHEKMEAPGFWDNIEEANQASTEKVKAASRIKLDPSLTS